MKATLKDRVIAESDDIVEEGGYHYFPIAVTRMEWLTKAPKTESDHACPHGVQFYDVTIEGKRHEVQWYDNEGHGWEQFETRRDAYRRTVAFLRRHVLDEADEGPTEAG